MTDTTEPTAARPGAWPPADDAELQAMSKARQQEYELEQLDRQLGITLPETGRELMAAAELRAALVRCSV